ncbi:Ig-like domain-containing protein [Mycolicibacterium sp. CR10]|uniref:Ig-like domain-containing protein n=1 Tax=Mycolicibacterium sp. CR10 TaxID=2562314 RepID=UPI0010C12B1A|nr:Ig-like domain-containing protein [Mycolicibacterium sp. CR10]
MDARRFAARLGPVAAMVGVGTAIAISGGGVAFAEPPSAASSSAQSEDSASSSPADDPDETPRDGSDLTVAESAAETTRSDSSAAASGGADQDTAGRHLSRREPTGADSRAERRHAARAESALESEIADSEADAEDAESEPDSETAGSEPDPEILSHADQPVTSTSRANAAAESSGGLTALFNNRTPTLNPAQTGQSPNGVVTGVLNAVDPDSSTRTYTVATHPTRGTVQIDAAGGYLYTPDLSFARTGTTDSFRVTVSDADSGFHIHGFAGWLNLVSFGLLGSSRHTSTSIVPVTVAPFVVPNSAPTGTAVVGDPDPATGVVLGTVVGRDADGDALTYRGTATTTKGAVSVTAAGAFTYTPTASARANAAAPTATAADKADAFTVTIDDGRGGIATVPVTVALALAAASPLAAFPGAEGFGSAATGGRGGSVVYVTNTNASGVGSLQWAIDQQGAKYILFKVSGVIDTQIHLTNGNVTIAGQSSPGGITIRGFVTDESPYQDQTVRMPSDFAENWILQHVRIRPGPDGRSDDGLRLRYTRNAIVDHVSIGNATDEAVEISYSNNITIQNSIIAETLGGHSFYGGVLMNYSNPAYGFGLDNVSLHHNIFNRIEGRLPEGSRESLAAANSTMSLELSNNLYWDPRFFIALGVSTNVVTDARGNPYPIYWKLNAVNNYFRTGAQFPYGMFDDQILGVPGNQLYVSGNKMSLYPTRSDYELFYCCNDYGSVTDPDDSADRAQQLSSRHPFPAITYTPTDALPADLLNRAGAWPRDPMDRRLLQSISQDTIASASPNTNPANDALLPAYSGAPPAAPADTDGDGMPDAWEIVRGLNPNAANHNASHLSTSGYSDLEVYLQELSDLRRTS